MPLTVDAPNSRTFVSRRLTSLPDTMDTAPVKLLDALSMVTLLPAPAVRLVVPATDSASVWAMSPFAAVSVRLPESVVAPKLMPLPAVGPWLLTVSDPAAMPCRVTAPLSV